jgi:hypothetical protein
MSENKHDKGMVRECAVIRNVETKSILEPTAIGG